MKQFNSFFREEGLGRFLLTGIKIAAVIWLIGFLGGFSLLDGFFYDQVFKTTVNMNISPIPGRVVLVEIDPTAGPLSERQLLQTIETIHRNKPGVIAFDFIPRNLSEGVLQKIEKSKNVIFGYPLEDLPNEGKSEQLKDRILLFKKYNIPIGVVGLPLVTAGISRHQPARYAVDGEFFGSLEVTAARFFLQDEAVDLPPDDYLVHFRGGPGSLPLVDLERVLKDDLVSQLIEGKCILVGRGRDSSTPGIYTPTTTQNNPMSLLEFHGHSLNTLVTGKQITALDQKLKLFIFIVISLLSLLLYHRLFMRMASWLTLLAIVSYGGITYPGFLLGTWLPLGEMILLQTVLFFSSLRSKNITADRGFQDLLLDLNAKLRERYYPTSIYRVKEHWAQVIAMVTQTLSLKRLIFLERVPKDHRVREVESFNCSLSDIDERRRDYHRFPYSEAIKNNGPLPVSKKRVYLKRGTPGEEQYLVPLSFAGDILGFWAFGIDARDIQAIQDFIPLIRDYAYIIGELLFNRQEIQRREARSIKLVHYLATEREHEAYRTLKQTIAFLKRRFDNLSNVFNGLNALTIVYDLFGRVLEVNQRMLELLKSQDLAPYKLTAADLVVKLTGNSLSHIQQLLRKVVNERRPLSFLVTLREKHYSLTIRPLAFNPVGDEFQEPAPFGIYGIVCELVETTSMLEVCELKEQMAEQFCDSLYHQLEDFLDLLASLEQSPGKEKQAKIIGICKYNIHNMIATINKWYAHKSRGSDLMDYSQILPVDPNRIIRMASDNLQSAAQEQQVVINITVPSPVSNVYAMPEFLRRTFERILTVIVKDTARKGKITVQAEEKDEWVKFDFSNKGNGFGTPGEKLKDQLFSQQDDPMMPLDMRKLRNALDWIKAWGGLLDVESDVGQGTRFTLHLARFN